MGLYYNEVGMFAFLDKIFKWHIPSSTKHLYLKHLYNGGPTSKTLVQPCTNVIQMFWDTPSGDDIEMKCSQFEMICRFWEMLAYLANTLIFILVGVVIMKKAIHSVEGKDWVYCISLFVAVTFIRWDSQEQYLIL